MCKKKVNCVIAQWARIAKMDKTIYSLNIYILYMFIGFFWVKESVFEVFRTLGAVMTPQVVIKWWSQVVIEGQDKVKAMRYVYL